MTIDTLLESVDDIEYKTLDEIIQEAKLKAKERNELQDELFGLPEQRKFPLNDYNHILAAIRFFNRADQKDQKELAKNIFKAMKKYKVPMSKIGKNNKLRNYLPKSVNEAGVKMLYFVSEANMDNKILTPKIPNNYFTKNGYEENKTPRVCFSSSIDKCLMGLSRNLKGEELYIHTPEDISNLDIYKPSAKEVPDSTITNEYWVKDKVKIKCIGKIKVIKDKGLDGKKFTFGNTESELYEWEYEWVEKYSVINEATIPVVGIKNKPMIVNHMMNNAFTSLSVDQDIISSCLHATANALMNKEDKYYLSYIPYISESSHMDPTIGFYVDRNGIFVMNESTGLRSPSYKNVDDIDDRTILYITYGELNDQRINSL